MQNQRTNIISSMAHVINLPLGREWDVEEEIINEEGEEVLSYYASAEASTNPKIKDASIELYVGNTPEDSDAKIECINSYIEAIGLDDEEEDIPVESTRFLGAEAWYYEAQDENECPVVLICAEPIPGTLVMAIISHSDEQKLNELVDYVDEHLKID